MHSSPSPKTLARERLEAERSLAERMLAIRRLPPLHQDGARIETAMERYFRGVESLLRTLDELAGAGARLRGRRR